MIRIADAFKDLTAEEYKQLLDAPVWMALYAAYSADGKITQAERADAIKLAHVRRFTAPKSIRELYVKIGRRFEPRLQALDDRLPNGRKNKLIYIRAQVKAAHRLLKKLDSDVAETLEDNLASFYKHVFNADKSFFHYFALPVVAKNFEQYSGRKKTLETV